MNDLYLEELIKRKPTGQDKVIKYGLIVLTVVFGLLAVMSLNMVMGIVFIALCVACYFVLPKSYIEWEYQYVNGEIDVDRILKKSKRKRIASYEITSAEIVAPARSHRLDYYNNNNKIKIQDFTSCDSQRENLVYAMILPVEGNLTKVLFEPSEQMLKDMRTKAPRKIFMD